MRSRKFRKLLVSIFRFEDCENVFEHSIVRFLCLIILSCGSYQSLIVNLSWGLVIHELVDSILSSMRNAWQFGCDLWLKLTYLFLVKWIFSWVNPTSFIGFKHLLDIGFYSFAIENLVFNLDFLPVHLFKRFLIVPHVRDPEVPHQLLIPSQLVYLVWVSDSICYLLLPLLLINLYLVKLVFARAFFQYPLKIQELVCLLVLSDFLEDLLLVDDIIFLQKAIFLLVGRFLSDCIHL